LQSFFNVSAFGRSREEKGDPFFSLLDDFVVVVVAAAAAAVVVVVKTTLKISCTKYFLL